MGDMVYAASLSYYAQMIAQGKMAVRPLKAYFELVGSSGIIGYKPKVEKLFGLPTRLTAGGMSCDLIDADMTEHSDNDHTKHVQANQQLGIIGSSLEHQVLEQLFAQHGEQGFSAVKAIQLANEQGQKIYTITQDNYQTIIPQLQLAPKAIADIQAAAQAGLTVTTHQKRIHVNGYTGEGYIILNERGDGAYLINGGGLYGGVLLVAGLTLAATGGMYDGCYNSNCTKPHIKRLQSDMIKRLGKTKAGLAFAGVLLAAISVSMDNTISIEDKIAQVLLALTAAWASGVFTASLAAANPFVAPWIIAFLGMIAAAIIAIATTVIVEEYFSFYVRQRSNECIV